MSLICKHDFLEPLYHAMTDACAGDSEDEDLTNAIAHPNGIEAQVSVICGSVSLPKLK